MLDSFVLIAFVFLVALLFGVAGVYSAPFTTRAQRARMRQRLRIALFYIVATPGLILGVLVAAMEYLITLWSASIMAAIESLNGGENETH